MFQTLKKWMINTPRKLALTIIPEKIYFIIMTTSFIH